MRVEKTYARLKTLGYWLTDQRKEILKVLGQAPGPLTGARSPNSGEPAVAPGEFGYSLLGTLRC